MSRVTDMLLDAEGLPVLTDRVADEELLSGLADLPPGMTTAEIAEQLLASEVFQQQLDSVSAELSRNLRLQVEQVLGTAIENAVSQALEQNSTYSFELIRQHLEQVLPELFARVMQEEDGSP